MTNILKAKTDKDLWTEILAHKDKYMLLLDNDITYIMDAKNPDKELAVFEYSAGDDDGFLVLLDVLKIKYELV